MSTSPGKEMNMMTSTVGWCLRTAKPMIPPNRTPRSVNVRSKFVFSHFKNCKQNKGILYTIQEYNYGIKEYSTPSRNFIIVGYMASVNSRLCVLRETTYLGSKFDAFFILYVFWVFFWRGDSGGGLNPPPENSWN